MRYFHCPPKMVIVLLAFLLILVPMVGLQARMATLASTPIVLYDGTLGPPDEQGFQLRTISPNPAQASEQNYFAEENATLLDSTANRSNLAGYFARAELVPVLDRELGYTLRFQAQVLAEKHDGSDFNNDGLDDRAGFNVIALSSDTRGVELGFWTDRVWAQEGGDDNNLFTQAEGAEFDTSSSLIMYELVISENTYILSSGDITILTGPLRDYTAFDGPIDPYETPNFIFLGDDSTSASAQIKLASVEVVAEEEMPPVTPMPSVTPVPPSDEFETFLPLLVR
ncbi:MAG: Ca2+-binding protein, RTX toxin-related [Chloroflexi bacterium AL-W]|nr:Ca2+-binding protein, RTX toxin-related [Chloroflexi bacterium AL-N1]NOK67919.1 Ca2+-binding protein, RTX toxin-related [Chloroflexi bacterium AL-N10]NOK73259.1 Ca2+-binding protein, RTX toxin-related [Chloroflexi bacterium AL-N5]NOK83173.1 Ca2+-binding protein, RTX toxin-related [Chloroflexi bacterium AL-W]NOK87590.1 Ca2+-binding protein, RTX toxin-related [Chloroflexi bacterium AL-N15]